MGFKKINEFESAPSKPGELAAELVKIESRDKPCLISVVERGSYPFFKLRDKYRLCQELRDEKYAFVF